MVEANIISYWSCSEFCRSVNKYIFVVLWKTKFQVVYHTLILLFWRLLFQVFPLAILWKAEVWVTLFINTVMSTLDTVKYVKICV